MRLIESRTHQKSKDYDALDPELDEDHVRTLRAKSKVDLTPLVIPDPPRMVEGERTPQYGNLFRNLVAA
jgi:hypothetical protein